MRIRAIISFIACFMVSASVAAKSRDEYVALFSQIVSNITVTDFHLNKIPGRINRLAGHGDGRKQRLLFNDLNLLTGGEIQ